MIEFDEDKVTISKLRDMLGKSCQRKTLRGWMNAGVIKEIKIVDGDIIIVANTGVRGSRDEKIRLAQCRLDKPEEVDLMTDVEIRKLSWQDRIAKKTKKLQEAEAKEKRLHDKREFLKRLSNQPADPEE